MKINRIILSVAFFFLLQTGVSAQSVVHTVHNLSVSGPGAITAEGETEVCVFCHAPHNSSPRKPLWNRHDPGLTYDLYSSSTSQSATGQPGGSSLLCLSCHDGTIGLGNVISRGEPIEMSGGIINMPDGDSKLGTVLSDDHPVSFLYNSALAASDGELTEPSVLNPVIKLEDESMQCGSCHDAHDNTFGQFLVAPLHYSELCRHCHVKSGWSESLHNTSTATWNGSGENPWFHTGFQSVAENACENCHDPHGAEGATRLTNFYPEENNCLICHNGNVAREDLQPDFLKQYRHNVYQYTGIHDPVEEGIVENIHVECSDCHNPHYSRGQTAEAPDVSGPLAGVRGIDTDGNEVQAASFQYEICYRCHADSPVKPGSRTVRHIEQDNVRLEFDAANPSFHPVEVQGQNANVPSLIAPLTESSIIYCSDCHSSDNSAAAGPHGSIWPGLLKFRYETADSTSESLQVYELCYQCHERSIIINSGGSFGEEVHRKHIVEEITPCNTCHDPHGINRDQGSFTNNTHLINFDLSIVEPSRGGMGRLEFIDDGEYRGQCYLYCHGRNHNPRTY